MSLKSDLNFIKNVLNDYKIGTLLPSSKYVIKKIIKEIKPGSKFIVEYGAGNGVVTKEILNILPPDGRLIAVELNNNLINELKKINDKRLTIIQEDAVNVSKNIKKILPQIDVIIASIPFTILNSKQKNELINNTYNALSNSGIFIFYQHIPIVFKYLKKIFGNIEWDFEIRNSIPCFILTARK